MAQQNRISPSWGNAAQIAPSKRNAPIRSSFRRHDRLFENAPPSLAVIREGWACRSRRTADGRRQILAILLPGDACGSAAAVPAWVDFSIVALSPGTIETHPFGDEQPAAMLEYALAETAIASRWIARLGQRSAVQKLTDLVDELVTRQGLSGNDHVAGAQFLLTQYDMADATGLTAIHVNRTLRDLRKADVLRMQRGEIQIPSITRLRAVAAGLSD